MLNQGLIEMLKSSEEYFNRSTSCLAEEHSTFKPQNESMTVAQQVAHVAKTLEWFIEGSFRPEGFDLDFEGQAKDFMGTVSLAAARERLAGAFSAAKERFGRCSDEQLLAPLPDGPVMGGLPRNFIGGAMQEHTAHHRGALTVYSRLLGLTPPMPYM
jgi:uncharacterized damage-inducible protein DinB